MCSAQSVLVAKKDALKAVPTAHSMLGAKKNALKAVPRVYWVLIWP